MSFAATPEAQNLTELMHNAFLATIKRHFQPTVSSICAFYDFQLCRQLESESAQQFYNALCALLVDCDLAMEDERKKLLAHQLVFGCRDSNTLQKLLTLKQSDFETIFAEMESQEKATENVRVIHSGSARGKIGTIPKGKNNPSQGHAKQKQGNTSNQSKQSLTCFGCGKPGHRVYSSECPARKA